VNENIGKFIDEFVKSLSAETFVKMTLGNYKGADEHLQKLLVRLIETKKGHRVLFQCRYDSRESVKNYPRDEAAVLIREYLVAGFRSGHLFTTLNDFQLDIGKSNSRLNIVKPTFLTRPSVVHDRDKTRYIDANAFYLKALGITTEAGEVKARQQDKWRQINKFVEILAGLVDNSSLSERNNMRVIDMGSGKGYLTFAAYDYFANVRGYDVAMTGVDTKSEIVSLCNDIAVSSGIVGLKFVHGSIEEFDPGEVDLLIALHACDTATDEALYKGISANAEIIVAAPCCHKEIRRQIKPPTGMKDFLKHGILLERTAEIVTDGLRSLLLERSGYATKVFEFISPEHTPKNNMITATRKESGKSAHEITEEIEAVKRFYSIDHQRLESLVS